MLPACLQTIDEIELARITMEIAWQRQHIAALQTELGPLQAAFEQFERMFSEMTDPQVTELHRIRQQNDRMEEQTGRIHARMVADPDGLLGAIFTEEEIREIGRIFGANLPQEFTRPAGERADDRARQSADEEMTSPARPQLAASDLLKSHYRDLARRFHPDLATTLEERIFRQEVMLRINNAWHLRDLDALITIENELDHLVPGWSADVTTHRLVWAKRELADLNASARKLTDRIDHLKSSRSFILWHNDKLAREAIARRKKVLAGQIMKERQRFRMLRDQLRDALGTYAGAPVG